MGAHLMKCFLAGLVAILPVGGLVVLVYQLEVHLNPLIDDLPFYFPGLAILAALAAIYLLGLTVSTFAGRWLWKRFDRMLEQVPGLAVFYQTLKQILGYGGGKEALFRRVVFLKHEQDGRLELGLLTDEIQVEGQGPRWMVFLPGSPNPTTGQLVLADPGRCIATKIPVDVAIKALLSTGKSGLPQEA